MNVKKITVWEAIKRNAIPVLCLPESKYVEEATKIVEKELGIEIYLAEGVRETLFPELPKSKEEVTKMIDKGEYFTIKSTCVFVPVKELDRIGKYAEDVGWLILATYSKLKEGR